jgi:hypothetical protein
MEGTDELREYIRKHTLRWTDPEQPSGGSCALDPQTSPDMLCAIADRIDAEHARIVHERVSKARAEGERNAVRQVRSASEDYRHSHGDAMREVEKTHVKLPVDADKTPWHIGDVDENGQTIVTMGLNRHGWHFVGAFNEIDPSRHRHYHKPTVEDKLWELLHKTSDGSGYHDNSADEIEAIVKEYAKMLRLAGDAE